MDNFSFLKARDPSIISGYIGTTKIQKDIRCKKLLPLLDNVSQSQNVQEVTQESVLNDEKHYQVFLRIKPVPNGFNKKLYSFDGNIFTCKIPDSSHGISQSRVDRTHDSIIRNYTFDKIFNENTSQQTIFNECIKGQILSFINGHSTTIMTYGASGSGKTFTILGDSSNPGIIPRSLEYLFRTLPTLNEVPSVKLLVNGTLAELDQTLYNQEVENTQKLLNSFKHERSQHIRTYRAMQNRLSGEKVAELPNSSQNVFSVWVSFFEIYNESIYDLLTSTELNKKDKKQTSLKLAQDVSGKTFVKNLTMLNVLSGQEAYELLQYGIHKVRYAKTSVNAHSSRSHCVFTICLLQSDRNGDYVQISKINFCDLAGSERVKDTCNKGERLKESNNINTSLHVLSRCLKLVYEHQKGNEKRAIIPYRQSKLTQLFKQALSGNEFITMIVNINPTVEMFDTTQHVLNFAAIAKKIVVIPQEKPSIRRISKFSEYLNREKKSSSLVDLPKSPSDITKQNNHNETQVDLLLEEISQLKEHIYLQQLLIEQRERDVRNEVVTEYRKIIDEIDQKWEKRMNDEIEQTRLLAQLQYELDNELEKERKKSTSPCKKRRRNSSDDSDSDDVVEDFEANIKYMTEKNQQLLELCKEKDKIIDEQERKLHNLETIIRTKDDEILQQKKIIEDAEIDYRDLEAERNSLKDEVKDLKQKFLELNDQVQLASLGTDCIESEQDEEENKENMDNIDNIDNIGNEQSASLNFSSFC